MPKMSGQCAFVTVDGKGCQESGHLCVDYGEKYIGFCEKHYDWVKYFAYHPSTTTKTSRQLCLAKVQAGGNGVKTCASVNFVERVDHYFHPVEALSYCCTECYNKEPNGVSIETIERYMVERSKLAEEWEAEELK